MFKKLRERTPDLKRNKIKLIAFVLICAAIVCLFTVIPINLWMSSGMETFGITSIRGDSMSPTIEDGGLLYYQPTKFERGEIIVASCPRVENYLGAYGTPLLKRIVGLPGEVVEITANGVLINGEIFVEDYIDSEHKTLQDRNTVNEILLSDGEFFILGDNRVTSFDSRHIGAVSKENFLYGVTTEPNEYTYAIWSKAALIGLFNLLCIVILPIFVFCLFTPMKRELTNHAVQNKVEPDNHGNHAMEQEDESVKSMTKQQPKSAKNKKKEARAIKAQKEKAVEQFRKEHKKR